METIFQARKRATHTVEREAALTSSRTNSLAAVVDTIQCCIVTDMKIQEAACDAAVGLLLLAARCEMQMDRGGL